MVRRLCSGPLYFQLPPGLSPRLALDLEPASELLAGKELSAHLSNCSGLRLLGTDHAVLKRGLPTSGGDERAA